MMEMVRTRTETLEVPTLSEASRMAANRLATHINEAISKRGKASVALSGGRTPRFVYDELKRWRVDWSKVTILFTDERSVVPGHPESNFGLAQEYLPYAMSRGTVLRMPAEMADKEQAALEYTNQIRRRFGTLWPEIDVVLLGVGADGHIASIFTDEDCRKNDAPVIVTKAPDGSARLSLALPLINRARQAVGVCAGVEKRPIAKALVEDALGKTGWPIARVHCPQFWLIDGEASGSGKRKGA